MGVNLGQTTARQPNTSRMMSSVSVSEEWIAVSYGDKCQVFHFLNDNQVDLQLPPTRPPLKESKQSAKSDDFKNTFSGIRFSPCGKWLAAYSSSKQLLLWETQKWTLVSERYMPKAATSLKFSPDGLAVVIVDKAGDSLLFSLQSLSCDGKVILGHLSMLLDVIITPDGKYIITCDRDEKIRVSLYPNAYNIISYCLGHREFVSSLHLLPHQPSLLLSSSGDGTIRLWEFQSAQSLVTYDCSSDAVKELVKDSSCLHTNEDGGLSSVIVKKICCMKLSNDASLMFVLVHGYKGCLVYYLEGTSMKYVEALCHNVLVSDFCIRNNGEVLLRVTVDESDAVLCFMYNQSLNSVCETQNSSLSLLLGRINSSLKLAERQYSLLNDVTQLLKRKFDNVKDYYALKKARLGEQ